MDSYADKNKNNETKANANKSPGHGLRMPAVSALNNNHTNAVQREQETTGDIEAGDLTFIPDKTPVQMVTVLGHFAAGKKVVAAGEAHGAIDEKAEMEYWADEKRDKNLVYENQLMNVDVGGDADVKMPIDNLHARILSFLNMATTMIRAMIEIGNVTEEATKLTTGDKRYANLVTYINTMLTDIGSMETVKQRGFDAPYTRRQQANARLIRDGLRGFMDTIGQVVAGTKGADDLRAIVLILSTQDTLGKGLLGAGPINLSKLRSRTMMSTMDGYARRASKDTVYKLGENHVLDILDSGRDEGDGWALVSREQYVEDTGLAEEIEDEEDDEEEED